MTTTPTSDKTPSAFTDEQYGAQRAEAAVWAGASVLSTDRRGRVLVERVGYRDTLLLPGGAVDKGESPAHAAARDCAKNSASRWHSTAGSPWTGSPPPAPTRAPPCGFPGRSCTSSTAGRGTTNRSPPSSPAKARSRRSKSWNPPNCPS